MRRFPAEHDLLGLTAGDTGHRLLPGDVRAVAEAECVSTESASINTERVVRGDAATEDDGHDRVGRLVSSHGSTQFGITERAGHDYVPLTHLSASVAPQPAGRESRT